MNLLKSLIVLSFIACCCINYSEAIKCYTCDRQDKCRNPSSEICNTMLATKTKIYLDFHHIGVNANYTNPNFECFREVIKSSAGEYHYKGCIYSNTSACALQLRDMHTTGKYTRICKQCNEKDKCNYADRNGINIWILLFATVVGIVVQQTKLY